jgi:hypothetical protein
MDAQIKHHDMFMYGSCVGRCTRMSWLHLLFVNLLYFSSVAKSLSRNLYVEVLIIIVSYFLRFEIIIIVDFLSYVLSFIF